MIPSQIPGPMVCFVDAAAPTGCARRERHATVLPIRRAIRLAARIVPLFLFLAGTRTALAGRPCHTDPRNVALLHLELSHQDQRVTLPGGCVTLVHDHVCVPHVSVDGHRLPDLDVLSGDVNLATSPLHPRPLQSPAAIHAGVASAVFNRLVDLAAQRDHIHVSWKAARALAEQELSLYQKAPPKGTCKALSPIPRGQTPRQYFLSHRTIAAYQHGLVIGTERQRILHQYSHLTVQPALRRWLGTQLPTHRILINGKPPTFSVAAAYH